MLDHRLETLEARALFSTVTLLNGMPAASEPPARVIEIEPISSWGNDGHLPVDEPASLEDLTPPPIEQPGPDDDMYSFVPGVDDALYEEGEVPFDLDEPQQSGVTSSTDAPAAAAAPAPRSSWIGEPDHRGRGQGLEHARVKASFIGEARPSYRDLQL